MLTIIQLTLPFMLLLATLTTSISAYASDGRPTIAILPPIAQGRAPTWIGMAIADELNSRLLVHRSMDPKTLERTYPLNVFGWRQTLAAARSEGIDTTHEITKKGLKKLKKQLGAEHFFSGVYKLKRGKIHLIWFLLGHSPPKQRKLTIAITDIGKGIDTIATELLHGLGQQGGAISKHHAKHLSVAALKPFAEGLAITANQSRDPRARLILTSSQLANAYALFTAATNAAPSFSRAWVERGITGVMLGDTERGEADLIQAMAQSGEFDAATAVGLYYLYDHRHEHEQAIEALTEAATHHPGFLLGLGYLGKALLRDGQRHKALEVFTQYRARAPHNPWVATTRAMMLSRIGQHQKAIAETKELLTKHPHSLTVITALASRQIDATQYDDAALTLASALKKHPEHPALLVRLSYIELENGDSGRALRLAQRAVKAIGKGGRGEKLAGYAHLNLGHALALAGEQEAAFKALTKAVSLGVSTEAIGILKRDKRMHQFLGNPKNILRELEGKYDHHHDHDQSKSEHTLKTKHAEHNH